MPIIYEELLRDLAALDDDEKIEMLNDRFGVPLPDGYHHQEIDDEEDELMIDLDEEDPDPDPEPRPRKPRVWRPRWTVLHCTECGRKIEFDQQPPEAQNAISWSKLRRCSSCRAGGRTRHLMTKYCLICGTAMYHADYDGEVQSWQTKSLCGRDRTVGCRNDPTELKRIKLWPPLPAINIAVDHKRLGSLHEYGSCLRRYDDGTELEGTLYRIAKKRYVLDCSGRWFDYETGCAVTRTFVRRSLEARRLADVETRQRWRAHAEAVGAYLGSTVAVELAEWSIDFGNGFYEGARQETVDDGTQVMFWRVGRNASHEFHLGAAGERRFSRSVGEGDEDEFGPTIVVHVRELPAGEPWGYVGHY